MLDPHETIGPQTRPYAVGQWPTVSAACLASNGATRGWSMEAMECSATMLRRRPAAYVWQWLQTCEGTFWRLHVVGSSHRLHGRTQNSILCAPVKERTCGDAATASPCTLTGRVHSI